MSNLMQKTYTLFLLAILKLQFEIVFRRKKFSSEMIRAKKTGHQETKRFHDQIEKDSDLESFSYKSLHSNFLVKLNSNRESYQKSVFESLQTDREKWNFFETLKNSFGDIITDQKRIANLLNYHCSKLGDFFGEKGKGLPTPNFSLASTSFKFQSINLFFVKKQ